MTAIRNEVRFLLNDREVVLEDVGPNDMLLDFLRLDRRLTGTKEGCAEGDCGACTVLVGRIAGDELKYETVNACIRFLASLDGCHVVSIEHLRGQDGGLHPVQQAMVDHHGSQCGFCTPGIVMSLYALWMQTPHPSDQQIAVALQGNLCRCTGYRPIFDAAKAAGEIGAPDADPLVAERRKVKEVLANWNDGSRVETGGGTVILPGSVSDLAGLLAARPNATIVAGATDVGLWVTKFMRDIAPVVFIGHLDELHSIDDSGDALILGAGVSYSESEAAIARNFPHLSEYWSRIAGWQVRNMGTVGGNIANGSPIGDTPPVLIALGASIVLRLGETRREVPLEAYFIEYGKQDRQKGEFVESVIISKPAANTLHAAYKISKRRDEDISSVAAGFSVTVEGGTITSARIAFGGMAGTPKRASNAEAAMIGKSWSEATLLQAAGEMPRDFTPLSDWRASADYRMKSAQNLFRRFWAEHTEEAETWKLPA